MNRQNKSNQAHEYLKKTCFYRLLGCLKNLSKINYFIAFKLLKFSSGFKFQYATWTSWVPRSGHILQNLFFSVHFSFKIKKYILQNPPILLQQTPEDKESSTWIHYVNGASPGHTSSTLFPPLKAGQTFEIPWQNGESLDLLEVTTRVEALIRSQGI